MKKKIIILLIFLGFTMIGSKATYAASNYNGFEQIEMVEGKLIKDYTSKELKDYYKKVDRKKMFGWNIHKINERVKIKYVTETIFSYYNDGYTPISYKYKMERKDTSKFHIDATGSIGLKLSKDGGKKFKGALDSSLKINTSYDKAVEEKETIDISLQVDPGTQVHLYIYGEGKITNGVAASYFMWIRTARGGFEFFKVTTQYQRLEKKKI